MNEPIDISDLVSEQGLEVNRQLYKNSPLSQSEVAREYKAGGSNAPALYNDLDPNLAIKHEKPEHRVMVMCKAQGMSNDAIAKQFGYTQAWVSQVLRQPWARKLLVELLQQCGVEAVQQALQGAALDSVFKLIDLRDSEKTPPNVQANCAINILDRILGKPTQKIESQSTVTHVSGDIQEIDSELKVIQAELERRGAVQKN